MCKSTHLNILINSKLNFFSTLKLLSMKFQTRYKFLCYSILLILLISGCGRSEKEFVNTLNMKFVRIEPGSFLMGESQKVPEDFGGPEYLPNGDWDEHPVHKVTISYPFYISESEVTVEQFKEFRKDYEGSEKYSPSASGISWYEALDFCKWLSEKEGEKYRLPTEAEWEYACRAGGNGLFTSGNTLDSSSMSNAWGIKNMNSGVAEWCMDWHGRYTEEDETDPLGVSQGFAKVVRGGGLDRDLPYYRRSANRAGMAPDFPPKTLEEMRSLVQTNMAESDSAGIKEKPENFSERYMYHDFIRDELNNQGNHNIGIRVVMGELPESEYTPVANPFVRECVKETSKEVKMGPNPKIPYFRKRELLPTPPENTSPDQLHANWSAGFHPAILSHHHSPALEVCPNGDVLAIYYTSVSETSPDVALIAARLRFGADEWDMPDLFLDLPDVDDHAPLLWKDKDTLRFFWGANKLNSGFPFQWITSTDNGANWSEINFPVFETLLGTHSAQPINTAFRDRQGRIYIPSDGAGPESVLWVSSNNGKTWMDTGGRTGGRHTSFALLRNGSILGMGGKSSDIDGYMPKSISDDGGRSWKISKTPFPALGSNQRPSLLRLASGRLFFAGDFQRIDGARPDGIKERGSYVALSSNEGQSWTIKKLSEAQYHESADRREIMKGETIGYSVARQGPNGLIHLITSMNEPCLHFEFNEAWILDTKKEEIESKKKLRVYDVLEYEERFPDGNLKVLWHAGIGGDGRYILDGEETWYYKNGNKQYEVSYLDGKKKGKETYWNENGIILWSWNHKIDGPSLWTTYWPNGEKKTESTWVNKKCEGEVKEWNVNGEILNSYRFDSGVLVN